MNWIVELKNRIRINEVVSNYCKVGNSRLIKCPFHPEKTPSFSIDTSKNIFYCFGCGVGGDAIKFVELIERVNFIEACTKLAQIYGIEKPIYKPKEINPLEIIEKWCVDRLKENLKARAYLEERGLKLSTIKDFRIGWLKSYEEVRLFCEKNKISSTILQEYGLPSSLLKVMCNRIIFPIGRPVFAFGGRTLYDIQPKYLNSAESYLFKKKNTLYGLYKSSDNVFLVEGYIDVCMCYQAGLNAAGTMGTAISVESIKQLWKNNNHVILCLDGDNAGRKATNRIALEILPEIIPGKLLTFIDLPDGEDPASLIKAGKDIKSIPQISLINKIWSISIIDGPPEIKVANYNDLLDKAKTIKDYNLRKLYLTEWKELWFNRKYKQKNQHISNIDMYENILISIVLYNLEIFDHIYDYLITLPLKGELENIREILIKNVDKKVDLLHNDVIKSYMAIYSLNKLFTIAPFVKGGMEEIIQGWLEIFSFYQKSRGGSYD